MQVIKIDENGYFMEDIILQNGEQMPKDCVSERPPQGLFKPKWTVAGWVEGATQEYLDSLANIVVEPAEIDVLRDYVLDIELRMILKDLEV